MCKILLLLILVAFIAFVDTQSSSVLISPDDAQEELDRPDIGKSVLGEAVPTTTQKIPEDAVKLELSFNKTKYNLGEPIIATLSIVNISSRAITIWTGGDYRSGRHRRRSFNLIHETGQSALDPLEIYLQNGLLGGLESTHNLAPGETWSTKALLNLYALPEWPGRYSCSAAYSYMDNFYKDQERFMSHLVNFEVLPTHSRMTESKVLELFEKEKVFISPVIIHGLQNETEKIPELIALAMKGSHEKDRMARNTPSYAAMSCAMLSDKYSLYEHLVSAIEEKHDPFLRLPLLFRSSIGPLDAHILEKYFDHPDRTVRQLALETALSLGNIAGVEKLPAALCSADAIMRRDVLRNACLYLQRLNEKSSLFVEGVNPASAKKVTDALLDGFRNETDEDNMWMYLLEFGFLSRSSFSTLAGTSFHSAFESDNPAKRAAAVKVVSQSIINGAPSLDEGMIDDLLPFLKKASHTHPDPEVRSIALQSLEYLENRDK